MPEFKVVIQARESGAIGIIHTILETVVVEKKEDIRLALYEGRGESGKSYEHIYSIRIEPTVETRKKTFAQFPKEREKICIHDHAPYRGQIPCTGPRRCTMCGMEFNDDKELETFRAFARESQ